MSLWPHLRGWFAGEDALVVAPGPSAHKVNPVDIADRWVIACNRAVDFCWPHTDLAVCFEPFVDPCWEVMRAASPPMVFAHLNKNRAGKAPHPRIVQVPTKNVRSWFRPADDPAQELWCPQSPFWGTAIASWLGFERVGLVGVDWSGDRFDDAKVAREGAKWQAMIDLIQESTAVYNLNPESRMKAATFSGMDIIRHKGEA